MKQETQIVRPIHYLGSKLRMLEVIRDTIDSVVDRDGVICDLFSGSGTVSKFLLKYNDVISVDIQKYSQVICEASMGCLDNPPEVISVIEEIRNHKVTCELERCFSELIAYEQQCFSYALGGNIAELYEIIEYGSLYTFEHNKSNGASEKLNSYMQCTINQIRNSELLDVADSMICRYFGGLYFSYEQAVALDCIAHWAFEQEGILHKKALAALLSTASDIVNTVGKQFAQPLKVRNANGELKGSLLNKIKADRSENVFAIYAKWIKWYFETGDNRNNYYVICDDYVAALDRLKGFNVSAIYADPPYTRYHYSRYYHVLETICLRDNPDVSTTFTNGKGGFSRAIYRNDRHQSPFCIKSQAEQAFELLFQKVNELKVPLVLSYSPFEVSKAVTPRLQTIEQIVEKAKQYFTEVTVVSPGKFAHSKLNSADKNFETNCEAELLIVCR